MGKQRLILLAVLLVAGVGAAGWLVWRPAEPQEPVYQGKRLGVWLDDYELLSHGSPGEGVLISNHNHKVDLVVRQIGTNAIPTLLRMLNAKDSPLTRLDLYLYEDRHYYSSRFTSTKVALLQNIEALMAFEALGADAKGAVPRLTNMYDRSPDVSSRYFIIRALGGIGPAASNAVPLLLRSLTNTGSSKLQYESLRALVEIHAEPKTVVPILIKLLKDPDVNVRMRTIRDLQALGADAQPAVPALVESLTDSVDYIRTAAAEALKIIDPEAAAKAGVK